ncbi:MAG: hypothetical protein SFY66_01985 [Oculatellaceae cyanobacterium bins.114]|nr:hypothetical protein [Oculatellaceae cyanobacterium bins.114]
MSVPKGLWRSGNLLVVHPDVQLPDRCIKTNQPAYGKRFRAVLYWHHPAIYLLILVNLMIYVVVALIVRKKAVVYLGITEAALQQQKKLLLRCWIVGIAGAILLISALALPSAQVNQWTVFWGVALMVSGLLWGIIGSRLVGAERIENEYVWIRGVSPAYLADLPQWNPTWRGIQ